ncbi:Tho complex subunit 7-domain-containing protein [Xylariales sp. PMI_506]|nr:Tho complex subunit 7-domain-containing protein [Xylariales sp. PMI_506]
MAPEKYGFLEDAEENELHHQRLLNVENKPFQRITKRLLAPGSFTNPNIFKLPTPPPDGSDGATPDSQDVTDTTALKEDILLDFAAFDSVVARLQFLATQNVAERQRYAMDRLRILETMESVRQSNATLRAQLDEARETLAQRKKFDELADKITGNRMLRARAEQEVNIAKLTEECEELQRESETYGGTWRERKEQFDKLVDEGVNLRRMIRDEQEEVERREGMDEGDAGDEDGATGSAAAAADTPAKGSQSGNATPALRSEGANTPLPADISSAHTPRPDSPGGANDGLKARPSVGESFSRGGSQAPSLRAGSPGVGSRAGSQAPRDDLPEEGEDVEMGESTQAVDTPMGVMEAGETPQITVDGPAGAQDTMDTT